MIASSREDEERPTVASAFRTLGAALLLPVAYVLVGGALVRATNTGDEPTFYLGLFAVAIVAPILWAVGIVRYVRARGLPPLWAALGLLGPVGLVVLMLLPSQVEERTR